MDIGATFAARDLLLASLEKSQQRQLSEFAPVIQADQSGLSIPITNLAASPNGEDLAWGLGSGLVQIYNLSQRGVTRSLNASGSSAVTGLAFTAASIFFLAIGDAEAGFISTIWPRMIQLKINVSYTTRAYVMLFLILYSPGWRLSPSEMSLFRIFPHYGRPTILANLSCNNFRSRW
jgi:hypothetical protein